MKGHLEPVPGGQDLLEFINFVACELHELRGFELPTMAILLHLDRAPGRILICTLADLSRLSGALESTAWRLAKILDMRNLICIQAADTHSLVLSLTPYGRTLLADLASALNA